MICDAFARFVPFYNLKNVKNAHGAVLLLLKLQATKSNTPSWVFFTVSQFTKSRKTSHISIDGKIPLLYMKWRNGCQRFTVVIIMSIRLSLFLVSVR